MMNEIEKLMSDAGASVGYRIVNLGGKSVYVEGIKSVISLSESEMQFQLKKGLIIISGTNLKIKYLDLSTCTITGEIRVVETK